jgi:sec-independent protein translocase protein TatA
MNLGATELLIILAVVLLLFGSTRLPTLFRSLGRASKEFKAGVAEGPQEEDRPNEIGPKDAAREETGRPASPSQT